MPSIQYTNINLILRYQLANRYPDISMPITVLYCENQNWAVMIITDDDNV